MERREGEKPKKIVSESAGHRKKKLTDMDLTGLSLGTKTSAQALEEYRQNVARRRAPKEAKQAGAGKKGKKGRSQK